jgi:hypothetical protein
MPRLQNFRNVLLCRFHGKNQPFFLFSLFFAQYAFILLD